MQPLAAEKPPVGGLFTTELNSFDSFVGFVTKENENTAFGYRQNG
jgi:hypothetical protein